jgi:hypothetical protein
MAGEVQGELEEGEPAKPVSPACWIKFTRIKLPGDKQEVDSKSAGEKTTKTRWLAYWL